MAFEDAGLSAPDRLARLTWVLRMNRRAGVEYGGPEYEAVQYLIQAGTLGEGEEGGEAAERIDRLREITAERLAHHRLAEAFPGLSRLYVELGLAKELGDELFEELHSELSKRYADGLRPEVMEEWAEGPDWIGSDQAPLTQFQAWQAQVKLVLVDATLQRCLANRRGVLEALAVRYPAVASSKPAKFGERQGRLTGLLVRARFLRAAVRVPDDVWRRGLERALKRPDNWRIPSYSTLPLLYILLDAVWS